MIPFQGALDFFLAFWEVIPFEIRAFVSFAFTLVIVVAVVRVVMDD